METYQALVEMIQDSQAAERDDAFGQLIQQFKGRLNKTLPSHPVLEPIAKRHGVSAHAVTIAWVMAQGETVIPIPGARTVEHALDSLTAARVVLDAEELDAITRAEFSRA